MVLKIGHKSEFAQGSHKVRIPVIFALRFWVGTESMLFENLSQKRIRTRGCVVRKFRTRGMGGANFAVSWLFSHVFPCFHSSSFPTYMLTQKTNSNHIRMKLKSKIKNRNMHKHKKNTRLN